MAEGNGSGRLDRIEALLESAGQKIEAAGRKIDAAGQKIERVADMGYAHDDRLTRIEISIEEMIDENKRREAGLDERIEKLVANGAALDQRIDKLVSAIGEWIARLPAPK
jgi:uncharacterized protein YaaN involved in tellurite resistance